MVLTGDVMYDAWLHYREAALAGGGPGADLGADGPFALATVHRAASTDDRETLAGLLRALGAVARELPVLLPLHPRTARRLTEFGLTAALLGIRVLPPQDYFGFVRLLDGCSLVLTDSGGVQKDAYFAGRPCVTVRTETEWTELVEIGANLVAGLDPQDIVRAAAVARNTDPVVFGRKIYGQGGAAQRIASALLERYGA